LECGGLAPLFYLTYKTSEAIEQAHLGVAFMCVALLSGLTKMATPKLAVTESTLIEHAIFWGN